MIKGCSSILILIKGRFENLSWCVLNKLVVGVVKIGENENFILKPGCNTKCREVRLEIKLVWKSKWWLILWGLLNLKNFSSYIFTKRIMTKFKFGFILVHKMLSINLHPMYAPVLVRKQKIDLMDLPFNFAFFLKFLKGHFPFMKLTRDLRKKAFLKDLF